MTYSTRLWTGFFALFNFSTSKLKFSFVKNLRIGIPERLFLCFSLSFLTKSSTITFKSDLEYVQKKNKCWTNHVSLLAILNIPPAKFSHGTRKNHYPDLSMKSFVVLCGKDSLRCVFFKPHFHAQVVFTSALWMDPSSWCEKH